MQGRIQAGRPVAPIVEHLRRRQPRPKRQERLRPVQCLDLRLFSEELLEKILRGISGQRYADTVSDSARAFGVSARWVSRPVVDMTSAGLEEFKNRSLKGFKPFGIFLWIRFIGENRASTWPWAAPLPSSRPEGSSVSAEVTADEVIAAFRFAAPRGLSVRRRWGGRGPTFFTKVAIHFHS